MMIYRNFFISVRARKNCTLLFLAGVFASGAVDAKDAITVKVEGGGKLIGLDNGELNYTGAFKTDTRNAYHGRLLITVQRTSPFSEVRVTATASGLTAATSVVK